MLRTFFVFAGILLLGMPGCGEDDTSGTDDVGTDSDVDADTDSDTDTDTDTDGDTDTDTDSGTNVEGVSYADQVAPVLGTHCVFCHGGAAGLWMQTYGDLMQGGPDGPVVIPGDPDASSLVTSVEGTSAPRMPLGNEPLAAGETALIRVWVEEGALDN